MALLKIDHPYHLIRNMKKLLILFVLAFGGQALLAQDSYPVRDIFYGTRAVNLMTTSQVGKKVLAYRISHRFGAFNSGGYNLFGLDGPANISLAFDYGITDDLMIGVARDGFRKVYNGFFKYNLINQSSSGGSPVTVSLYSRANVTSLRDEQAQVLGFNRYDNFGNRMSYVSQIMVARKFGERISAQLAPTFVYHGLVERNDEAHGIVALAAAAQYKVTKRIGISGEYTYVLTDNVISSRPGSPTRRNSAAIGLDIVTGGHVFQICVVNSVPINETFAIPYTLSDWANGDIRLGFNISRKFWF